MTNSYYNDAAAKIDSILTTIGITDKEEISEKLLSATLTEYTAAVADILRNSPDSSKSSMSMPSNGEELQKAVTELTNTFEKNGTDPLLKWEESLNNTLSGFLDGMEGSIDIQVLSGARALLS